MRELDQAQELQPLLSAWRREIHQYPEIGFTEERTPAFVCERLKEFGIPHERPVGRNGVVGTIGQGSPVVGIRADMDALPIQEANDVEYASQRPGIMHACGHDAHTAILLGAAHILQQHPDRPPGEIRLLFQPCEEGSVCRDDEGYTGAGRMMQDGALRQMDAVIALHVSSDVPVGIVKIDDGPIHASSDTFRGRILGEGCHGAHPDTGVDPIYLLAHVIHAIQAIRSRRLAPTAASVVSIGSVQAGNAANVIPDSVVLSGTIRSYDEAVRAQLHEELARAFAVTRAYGGDYELDIIHGNPVGINDAQVASTLRRVARDVVGEGGIQTAGPTMGAEDFSLMTRDIPGAMFRLGAKLDEVHRPHHSPIFDINEDSFPLGAAILAGAAQELLRDFA
ncbi:MAG: amidohydrolase [Chloroflexi bacterium]|nr:amidohydrolase [Chloroflexota bacterium]MCY4106818.1 amidohydrolase [Chloroflexota bacterium]